MRQVTAAVIIEDGKLLLARRAPDETLAGMWELPGGKIEVGETPSECLRRELEEELSMTAEVGAVIATTVYHYDHGSFEMLAIEAWRKSDYTLTVHDELRWVTAHEVETLPLAPADVKLVGMIRELGTQSFGL